MSHPNEGGTVIETCRSGASLVKCTSFNLEELEKNVIDELNEFERKIELGRKLKIIINKHGFDINTFSVDKKDAYKTYELYVKNMDMKEIIWRGWLKEMKLESICMKN